MDQLFKTVNFLQKKTLFCLNNNTVISIQVIATSYSKPQNSATALEDGTYFIGSASIRLKMKLLLHQ